MFRYKSKFKKKKVGACNADRIWIVKSNVLSVDPASSQVWFLSDKGPTLETLTFIIRIASTPTGLFILISISSNISCLHMDSEPLRRLNLFVFGSVDKKSNV